MKIFSEMMISSRSETEYCHPPPEETAWPAMFAAPTTLLTSPAGVLARFLLNRSGSAAGSFANASAEPTNTSPNDDPANATAPTGPDRWNTTASPMPMQEPLHPGILAGVASRVIRLPSRSTVTDTGFPIGWARIATPSCVQLCTGVPPTAMILSPALIPAALAGEACLLPTQEPWLYALRLTGTQALTPPIALVFGFSLIRPIPSASASSSTTASAKCMNEPATMTMARCQAGLFRIERGSSAGSASAGVVMPGVPKKGADRQALDAVLGLAARGRPQGRPEADEELGGLHAELLGSQEVPGLVQDHRDQDGHHEDDHTEQETHPAVSPSLRRRRVIESARCQSARAPCSVPSHPRRARRQASWPPGTIHHGQRLPAQQYR